MKTLVIAEKPSVGRDIARVLGCKRQADGALEGGQYIVTWGLGHLVELAGPLLRVGDDLAGLLLGGVEHLAVGDLGAGLQLRLAHHAVHIPLGVLHELLPGGQQLLGPLDLHRQLGPQLIQQIQHLIPVHHAHAGLERRGLGLLDPLIEHVDEPVDVTACHGTHSPFLPSSSGSAGSLPPGGRAPGAGGTGSSPAPWRS